MLAVLDRWPSKNILISNTIHMPWIQPTSIGIHKIIAQSDGVPHISPVQRGVKTCTQLAVHKQEPRQSAIYSVMECSSIERVLPLLTNEVLIVALI